MSPRAIFLLILSNFLGGSSYVATAYALRGFTSLETVFLRTLLGGFLFLPFLIRTWRRLKLDRVMWMQMAVVGVVGYAVPLTIGTVGQNLSSATNASLLVGVEPLAIVFLSALFLGEGLTLPKMAAILSGLTGSTLIVLQGIPFWNAAITPHFLGDILLFLHGICWALYSILGKPLLRKVNAMSLTSITTVIGLIPMTLALGSSFSTRPKDLIPISSMGGIIYLAVFVTFLGTLTWNKALELVPASQLANFIFLQPLVGVVLGVFLQNELFTVWSGVGGFLILLGVYGATKI
ncbi:MAG: DMT family transporter [Elusimicrobia bacterium]|nr:DMT family transporter [Elusimicrobiota bacterium]